MDAAQEARIGAAYILGKNIVILTDPIICVSLSAIGVSPVKQHTSFRGKHVPAAALACVISQLLNTKA